MGTCNLNHSQQDVRLKLESQMGFLPKDLSEKLIRFLESESSQESLNELFHLLKKYDLASKEEQDARNEKLNHFMK
ncbi:hypothetical protein [Peribacillus sp. NPDC096540]|uniref:hypothetical protein n=1 Tax=Peribacillus sp. NPDC096540 TaxID=3390612 RepID=UPI003CFDE842